MIPKSLIGDNGFDQIAIAFGTQRDMEVAKGFLATLGADDWTDDRVVAAGSIRTAAPIVNIAELRFNYQLFPNLDDDWGGLEFELLHYEDGPNWLQDVRKPCISHMGKHVQDFTPWLKWAEENGFTVAQNVTTVEHTGRPYETGRRYRYVIIGTRHVLGFDIKLIKRFSFVEE